MAWRGRDVRPLRADVRRLGVHELGGDSLLARSSAGATDGDRCDGRGSVHERFARARVRRCGMGVRRDVPRHPARADGVDADDPPRSDQPRAFRRDARLAGRHGPALDRRGGRFDRRPSGCVGRSRSDRPNRHLARPPAAPAPASLRPSRVRGRAPDRALQAVPVDCARRDRRDAGGGLGDRPDACKRSLAAPSRSRARCVSGGSTSTPSPSLYGTSRAPRTACTRAGWGPTGSSS
jgi:hypothetical protein